MNSPLPPDYNPYASPAVASDTASTVAGRVRAPGENVKFVYLALAVVTSILFFAIRFNTSIGLDGSSLGRLIALVDGPLVWARIALACVWIYYAWSGLPERSRNSITPGSAVVRLFIPLFNLYWVFVVNLLLCRALNRILERAQSARRASPELAVVATVLAYLPNLILLTEAKSWAFLVIILDTALWFAYMVQTDAARREVLTLQST